jgi:amino acid transporter
MNFNPIFIARTLPNIFKKKKLKKLPVNKELDKTRIPLMPIFMAVLFFFFFFKVQFS